MVPSNLENFIMEHNLNNIQLEREISLLEKTVNEVKSKGAEIIILMSSNGIPWNREETYQKL